MKERRQNYVDERKAQFLGTYILAFFISDSVSYNQPFLFRCQKHQSGKW